VTSVRGGGKNSHPLWKPDKSAGGKGGPVVGVQSMPATLALAEDEKIERKREKGPWTKEKFQGNGRGVKEQPREKRKNAENSRWSAKKKKKKLGELHRERMPRALTGGTNKEFREGSTRKGDRPHKNLEGKKEKKNRLCAPMGGSN